VSGAIWNHTLPNKLMKYLPDSAKKQAMAIYKSMVVAKKFAKGTPVRAAIDRSYRETQKLLAIAGTVSLSLMLFVMFALKTVDLEHVEEAKLDENKSDGEDDEATVSNKGGVKEVTKSEN
jgi:hypothetical protein